VVNAPVERPTQLETTALGAAYLAGLATGVWADLQAVAGTWAKGAVFAPTMAAARRAELVAGWRTALRRTLIT
jgi:glycerol kinase